MSEKKASVHWEGAGKTGQGEIGTETGALKDYPYGLASSFGDDRKGRHPEEIVGAAREANCPLSKALVAVPEITLQATLRT